MEIVFIPGVTAMTGVSPATLRYWRCVGEGPPSFKIGRRVAYRRAEVEKWLADQEAAARREGGGAA